MQINTPHTQWYNYGIYIIIGVVTIARQAFRVHINVIMCAYILSIRTLEKERFDKHIYGCFFVLSCFQLYIVA